VIQGEVAQLRDAIQRLDSMVHHEDDGSGTVGRSHTRKYRAQLRVVAGLLNDLEGRDRDARDGAEEVCAELNKVFARRASGELKPTGPVKSNRPQVDVRELVKNL
jgi:hypothetical protein